MENKNAILLIEYSDGQLIFATVIPLPAQRKPDNRLIVHRNNGSIIFVSCIEADS